MNLNEIVVIAEQTPGQVSFHNFEDLREYMERGLYVYKNTVYTPENLNQAEKDLKDLKAIKKKIADKKKELETAYSMPIEDVKKRLDELLDMVKEPMDFIDKMIKTNAKLAKQRDIMVYARSQATALGEYSDRFIESSAFFNDRWLNATYKDKDWKADIDKKVYDAGVALETINKIGGNNTGALLGFYFDKLSLDGAEQFMELVKSDAFDEVAVAEERNALAGYKILKVYGTERQMLQLMTQLDFSEMEYEEIEDGMPKEMEEITESTFDTFVAFDIEHTGTFGINNGDAESEIIEIGAVKVENGNVIERFDMLANPGRKIVPMIARLTNITDEMVAKEPPVSEVIMKFKEFVGDSVLVGHNIKSCDIPHIIRAARKAGVSFDNAYLDTKKMANRLKAKKGWENIKLPYLAQYYGIKQEEAHRAWCDAEANAYVYLELRKE